MMRRVRVLAPAGLERFETYLCALRTGSRDAPPWNLLDDPATSLDIDSEPSVDPGNRFTNRLDAARYLECALMSLDRAQIDHSAGLWSWLGLLYFDQLCPAATDAARIPGKSYRYILPALSDPNHYRHYYRHLLAGSYTIGRLHQAGARVLLCGAVDKLDDFNEQIASRQEFITNPGIVQALDLLYFDTVRGRAKRGAAPNRRKPGTLRRFVDVIQQLDLTHDLYSMSGLEILKILPPEFGAWMSEE